MTRWRAIDQPRTRSGLAIGLITLGLLGLLATRASGPWQTALLGLVVAGLITAARSVLSRVRLTDAGVEVRTFTTRTYAWAEIRTATLAADRPGVLLELRNAGAEPVRLPVPAGGAGEPALREAVRAIRARLRR